MSAKQSEGVVLTARIRRTTALRRALYCLPVLAIFALLVVPLPSGVAVDSRPDAGSQSGPSAGSDPVAVNPQVEAPAAPWAAPITQSMDWGPLTPPAPVGVSGGGFAAFSNDGSGVLFGGAESTGLSGLTYLYNESENSWTLLSPTPAPSPRSDFGFAADNASDSAVLFGGEVDLATGAVANDTWVFQLGSGTWTNVTGPVAPAPRQDPAFAVGDGLALLFGGWVQNVSGTGELSYSDTWVLNLTTDAWTRVVGGGSPGALHGAGLIWQPTLSEFLLYGGCYPCSSTVWAFSPSTLRWGSLVGSGEVPAPRMDAVWSWDPVEGVDILFGGTNGTATFDSTYYYWPNATTWVEAVTSEVPNPRYSAAADFLAVPGNATLLLTGGTSGTEVLSDTWRFSAVANLSVQVVNASSGFGIPNATVVMGSGGVALTNSTGYAVALGLPSGVTTVSASQAGYADGSDLFWLPPGASVSISLPLTPLPPATASINVVDPNGLPVSGAKITLSYDSRPLPGGPYFTGTNGNCLISDIPAATYLVGATHTGYHAVSETVDLPAGMVTIVDLNISPLFALSVRALGLTPGANVTPLDGAAILVAGQFLGYTGSTGYLNATLTSVGVLKVEASIYAYINSTTLVNVTFTGSAEVNLTLNARPYPTLTIEILGQRGNGPGFQVRNATVAVRNTTALPTGPYQESFVTDVEGTVMFSPPAGNYSVQVSAPGFLPNDSVPVIDAPPGSAIGRTIYLQLIGFSNIQVLVLSAAPGNPPVPNAQFALSFSGVNLSDGLPYPPKVGASLSTGWANFSGIPQGTTYWSVVATGYLPENGTFSVVFGSPSHQFTIYLVPIPPPKYTGLNIFPVTPSAVWSLVLLPIACLVGALVYLTMLRNPASRDRELRETARANRGGMESAPRR